MFGRSSKSSLRHALTVAENRLKRATKALAPKHKGGELEEYYAAHEEVLAAQRALAAALNEPYAVRIDFPVQWDTGAPLPYMLQNDYRTFLVFFMREIDQSWDGSYTSIRHPDSPSLSNLAVVEFQGCVSAKMGGPNDEVFHGHPLYGKGLEAYRPLRVENSPWIKELEKINSVHSRYNSERWRNLNHYIFGFHDSTVECIASSLKVTRKSTDLPSLLSEICKELVE